jgi:hypothetical protein
LIAGVGVTLYRNDVLRQAAVSYGQEKTYLKVEAALGGPGFGTPRAVQLAAPTSLNGAAAEAAAQMIAPPATRHAESPSQVPEPTRPAEPTTNSAAAASPAPVSLGSLVATQLPTTKAKAKAERAASAAAPARSTARSASGSTAPARDLGIKGSSNGYDPLNGKL